MVFMGMSGDQGWVAMGWQRLVRALCCFEVQGDPHVGQGLGRKNHG